MSTPLRREQFAVTQHYAYFNHAAIGVLPNSTVDAVTAFAREQAQSGVLGVAVHERRMAEYRERIGSLIGAGGDEIATVASTSAAANAAAAGIVWEEGDEVVLCDNEFPANAVPWLALRRRGVHVRLIDTSHERLTPDVLRREVGPRTRAVTVSWVSYADGYRHDLPALAEVAHNAGAWFFVDAIQGLGAFALDVRAAGIDALFCGAQKWLLALNGAAFLYVRRDLIDRLLPSAPGWRSMEDVWAFDDFEQPYSSDALRFEGGTPNFIGTMALARSIETIQAAGTQAIERHVLGLTDRLVDGLERAGAQLLTARGEGISSGIVAFAVPGFDSVELGRALQREGIVTTYRPSGVRCAPHGYNTGEEIDRLCATLVSLAKRPA